MLICVEAAASTAVVDSLAQATSWSLEMTSESFVSFVLGFSVSVPGLTPVNTIHTVTQVGKNNDSVTPVFDSTSVARFLQAVEMLQTTQG